MTEQIFMSKCYMGNMQVPKHKSTFIFQSLYNIQVYFVYGMKNTHWNVNSSYYLEMRLKGCRKPLTLYFFIRLYSLIFLWPEWITFLITGFKGLDVWRTTAKQRWLGKLGPVVLLSQRTRWSLLGNRGTSEGFWAGKWAQCCPVGVL